MEIIVLGGGIQADGKLPDLVVPRLQKTVELFEQHDCSVITSGRYSYLWPTPYPKKTESQAMAEALVDMGVPKSKVRMERRSKDTVSNAYYVKHMVRGKHVLVVTSTFHLKRTAFIFRKVFGPAYRLQFFGVPHSLPKKLRQKVIKRQAELLRNTQTWLRPMRSGHDEWLAGVFFSAPFYKTERPAWVKQFVAKGK